MPPLQTNATLTAVHGRGGAGGDFGEAAPGPEKWAGAERVYYRLKEEKLPGEDGAVDVVVRRTLLLGGDAAALELLDVSDVVSFEPDQGDPETGEVQAIGGSQLAGMPAAIATTRVELENA